MTLKLFKLMFECFRQLEAHECIMQPALQPCQQCNSFKLGIHVKNNQILFYFFSFEINLSEKFVYNTTFACFKISDPFVCLNTKYHSN